MTFSLLARDPQSGALGGAAVTGNLCVGAWVLRGRPGVGISASQGHYPSTLWGENVLDEMRSRVETDRAIKNTVAPDGGRAFRQLVALSQYGQGGAFSGQGNVAQVSHLIQADVCSAGNMLTTTRVVEAAVDGYRAASGSLLRRLLNGLEFGAAEGGDVRGLMSAAVLIVAVDHPPIDLRIDFSTDPLGDLANLVARVEKEDYVRWMQALPTREGPFPTH
ncbi:MAG: DUF1028 domain-containing protein [Pseudomonadota bacterium]